MSRGLGWTQRAVLTALADRPMRRHELEVLLGTGERNVNRVINRLIDAGLIRWVSLHKHRLELGPPLTSEEWRARYEAGVW